MRLKIIATAFLLCLGVGTRAQVSKMESEYLRLAERFEERATGVQNELKTYLKEYPYTTYETEVHYMIGAVQTERGYYKQALKELDAVDGKIISRSHYPSYLFYRAYCYLMTQEYARAETLFGQLRKQDTEYQERAAYYYAYVLYKQQKFDKALPVLLTLEQSATYRETVPYYLTQIYYQQQDFDEVRHRAEALLQSNPENANNGELNRMLGEIYYRDGSYAESAESLDRYVQSFQEQGVELVRNDLYLLGMARYKLSDYPRAIASLKQVKQKEDTISESARMTLGNSYRAIGQIEQAKLNYQAAMEIGLTPQIKEEAMYNYTLACYQTSTALGESVTAFTSFLNTYPHSKHTEQVYSLMCDAFLSSKNYAAALSALDSIRTPNARMQETKQYLRYKLGTDAFVQGNMEKARQWFTEVRENAKAGDKYLNETYYWRAESNYRLRNYEDCAQDLAAFFADKVSLRSPNYKAALYLDGYTCFNRKEFTKAQQHFRAFLDRSEPQEVTYADAMNRIGDCAFNARRFDDAISCYSQVIALNSTGSDYATFQKGYAEGLKRQYGAKVETMQLLVSRYPKSDFADDGLYEQARALLQLNKTSEAIAAYEKLLKVYPHSNLARKASVERAMLYRNTGNTNQAIAAYKQTIATYPGSEEAYTALDGLEAIYVETNQIAEYLAYTKQLGRLNMSVSSREDSLSYAAAELQYMLGNYKQAAAGMATYLSQYCPGGRNCTSARYYSADAYYRLGKTAEALADYKLLSEISGNPYLEDACTRVAELSYDQKDYSGALSYFYRMLEMASSAEKADVARLGILRCSYYLGRHQATIDVASEILAADPEETIRQEALYNRAKAYYAQEQYGMAIVDLTPVSQDVRTAIGAECKYLLAEAYYHLGARENAEQEIMSFAGQQTSHQYWLAKSLILLSDINVDNGDDFQAEQYLLTLRRNYTRQDDILQIVADKLAAIHERQTEKVVEEL